jgi:hypothetical protein
MRVVEHNAYDRFFTSIEQRVSRDEIMALRDTYGEVTISENIPYWHFVCRTLTIRQGRCGTYLRGPAERFHVLAEGFRLCASPVR